MYLETYSIINLFLVFFFCSTQFLCFTISNICYSFTNTILFLLCIWQHTSLFIISHDIHHLYKKTPLDIAVANLSLFLYAGFTLNDFSEKHSLHHQYPGVLGKDPDFSTGNFLRWYLTFMSHYINIKQIIFVYLKFYVLFTFFPSFNVYTFSVLPSVLSSLQLFYFGTYLVHSENGQIKNSNFHPAFTFLTSFNFGYHEEHHKNPDIKWYLLRAKNN